MPGTHFSIHEEVSAFPRRAAYAPEIYPLAEHIVCMVSDTFGVARDDILNERRSRARVAHMRQLAMYLLHVSGGYRMSDVAGFFGRDRSTVSYACARVEDRRESRRFDELVSALETRLTNLQADIESRGRYRDAAD